MTEANFYALDGMDLDWSEWTPLATDSFVVLAYVFVHRTEKCY